LTFEGKEEICHAAAFSKQHMEKASSADKEKDSIKKTNIKRAAPAEVGQPRGALQPTAKGPRSHGASRAQE